MDKQKKVSHSNSEIRYNNKEKHNQPNGKTTPYGSKKFSDSRGAFSLLTFLLDKQKKISRSNSEIRYNNKEKHNQPKVKISNNKVRSYFQNLLKKSHRALNLKLM
ncbi:hypothetical protein [Avibacterium gallinarum]|uniref:hypothetical protein n=1 Tax=Avibacterium gallinarum TaxID=755 RepID=UPI000F5128D7|nr:hypothetical protein [Avibacterium gallinarum]